MSIKVDDIKVDIDTNKLNQAIGNIVNERTYDVTCPFCSDKINIPTGKSLCPNCGKEIDLSLNITHRD